jgi:hypothetical protein
MRTKGMLEPPKSSSWMTPRYIVDGVIEIMDEIDIDPCSNSLSSPNVPAKIVYTEKEDGLTKPWNGRIYMNPPYGGEIRKWAKKWYHEYKEGRMDMGIALVAARTDTRWWKYFNDTASAACFVSGRIKFISSNGLSSGSPTFPSVLVLSDTQSYKYRRDKFISVFKNIGNIWIPVKE